MQSQTHTHEVFELVVDAVVLRELLNTEIIFVGGGEAAVNSY